MAHSGEELKNAGLHYYLFIYLFIYLSIFFCSSQFFFFLLLSLLLLPASSSWGRLPFLAGEVGCLFWQEVGCLFLAGKVGCVFWQEVGCLFGRIIFRVVVILRACVRVAVAEFFCFFLVCH